MVSSFLADDDQMMLVTILFSSTIRCKKTIIEYLYQLTKCQFEQESQVEPSLELQLQHFLGLFSWQSASMLYSAEKGEQKHFLKQKPMN